MNLDYGYTPIPNFSEAGRHRATADPVITYFKGDYYLFSTNQWGYWWSSDLYNWNFVSRRFLKPWHKVYGELCAPAVFVVGDTLCVIGSTCSSNFPIWMRSTGKPGNPLARKKSYSTSTPPNGAGTASASIWTIPSSILL